MLRATEADKGDSPYSVPQGGGQMRRLAVLVALATMLYCMVGCGISNVDRHYDKFEPGSIQRDDYSQKNPRDSLLFGGGPR